MISIKVDFTHDQLKAFILCIEAASDIMDTPVTALTGLHFAKLRGKLFARSQNRQKNYRVTLKPEEYLSIGIHFQLLNSATDYETIVMNGVLRTIVNELTK